MHHSRLACVVLTAILLLALASSAAPAVVYVKWDSPGPALDGTSWAKAFHTVEAGLNAASSGDEVWVARGLYIENIDLKDGVGLYGGFAGAETARAQRNARANVTILDGSGEQDSVVEASEGMTAVTVIDGFTIRGGNSPGNGGGVACWYCSPTISNNIIIENWGPSWGGGIYCLDGSPLITGNVIVANGAGRGGGIGCYDASPVITNNTIVSNSGDGIWTNAYSSPIIRNNIVSFNTAGIYVESGSGSPTVQYNCVYGNAKHDFYGPYDTYYNVKADPKLADRTHGNVHIQPGSPCINAGLAAAMGILPTDCDGQERVQGGRVDIGADESDGTTWAAGPYAVVRVSPHGSDSNDGSSWALAKQTLQAGIDAASAVGGEVWVGSGIYYERIMMRPYAHIYGGFAGTESARGERDWTRNRCVIENQGIRAVVTAQYMGYLTGRIDGFTIRGGSRPYWAIGGGVSCISGSPIIANNLITGNSASTRGGGIGCGWGASPIIVNNLITGNFAPSGAGIGCESHNGSWPTITNNTIVGNTADSVGGGILCDSSSPWISNNIVASNTNCGIYVMSSSPVLRNNCVHGNSLIQYSGVAPGVGDISADPLLFDPAGWGFHLTQSSPCIDAGWTSAPWMPETDVDGAARVYGSAVDIGAYEYPGVWSLPKVRIPLFSPDGGAFGAGLYVTIDSVTPGAVVHYTTNGIDPTESDPVYDYLVRVDDTCTLKARAFKAGWAPSDVQSRVFTIMSTVATPTFDPGSGAYTSPQYVTISCATEGATIRYTTDGNAPQESDPIYTAPVLVDRDLTLTARAWKTGWLASTLGAAVYHMPLPAPSIMPDSGLFSVPQYVTITSPTPSAVIRYTTNGIDPTQSDAVYTAPVLVDGSLTLKARAYKEGWPESAVTSADYEIDLALSVGNLKLHANDLRVEVSRALVSAAFAGYFYIQADDRSSGIRVDKYLHTAAAGMRVDIGGTLKTNTFGERYILAASVAQSEPPGNTGTSHPLQLVVGRVGGGSWNYSPDTGAGQVGITGNIHLNNVGLLVTTAGEVTYSPSGTYFVISDGSRVTDVSGYQGIRATIPTGVTKPAVGKHAIVTGICALIKSGTQYYPMIRVRSQADIMVID